MTVRTPPRARSSAFSFRRLRPDDARVLSRFLAREPAMNAFFLGQVARDALADEAVAGHLVACFEGNRIVAAACLGSTLVLSHLEAGTSRAEVLAIFAELSRRSGWLVKVVVGPDAMVPDFIAALGLAADGVMLSREGQHLFEVDRASIMKDARSMALRPAVPHELDTLVAVDLDMVQEELGLDPFTDRAAYRRGWARRIAEWRSWVVGPVGGPIAFKVDQAAVAPEVVQLAGVYTAPAFRKQGLAHHALGEMCHLLLREVRRVCLYVHPSNEAAIRLYRGLGFYEVGRVGSRWLKS